MTKTFIQEAIYLLINRRSISPSDENLRVVDNELPTCRNNLIFPTDFNNNVVLKSEEEELEENALCVPHLGRISNDASLYRRDYLVISAFNQNASLIGHFRYINFQLDSEA